MHYRYQPYPYYRRHYNISPLFYRNYYNPYYQYMQNIINSQIATVDQRLVNYGSTTNVSQDSTINQILNPRLRAVKEGEEKEEEEEE